MQAEDQDAPGRSPREHEFSDLEERISEDSVPLEDAALLLEVHDEVQVIPPVGRRSQPPMSEGYATHAVDPVDEAQTGERISYFEKAQAEAYQQTPIAAFAQEHAASLARAQGQSRYEQAWADWDRQFDLPTPVISSPLEPTTAQRSRLLVPGLALVALLGLGAAGYALGVVPGSQDEDAQTTASSQSAPSKVDEAARAEEAQRAADEATARADEAAKAAQVDTTKVAVGDDEQGGADEAGGSEAKVKVANTDEESAEARRERIREEKRAARREARHRRREERRLAAKEGGRSESVISAREGDDDVRASNDVAGETAKDEPRSSKKKKRASSGEDSDDPLYGLE